MALPSSGQMAMTAVATEFSVSSTNISLSNLGTKLSEPITAGQPVELADDFYGQSSFSGTSFNYNSEGQETGNDACNLESVEDVAYHDGSGTYPVANDHVYTNSTGTTLVATGTYKYYNGTESGGYMVIVEDGNGLPGLVQSVGNCGR